MPVFKGMYIAFDFEDWIILFVSVPSHITYSLKLTTEHYTPGHPKLSIDNRPSRKYHMLFINSPYECKWRATNRMAEADKLEKAVADVIAEGKDVTYDMKPNRDDPSAVGTKEMADAIIEKIKSS